MNSKTRLTLGILTALAMFALTFVLPRETAMRDAVLVQFPMTVGVWAIFRFALREIEDRKQCPSKRQPVKNIPDCQN
jgi:hypothetical protein